MKSQKRPLSSKKGPIKVPHPNHISLQYESYQMPLSPKFASQQPLDYNTFKQNTKSNQRPSSAAQSSQKKQIKISYESLYRKSKSIQKFSTISTERIEQSPQLTQQYKSSVIVPNYSNSLNKSTKELNIYNQLIEQKQSEKQLLKQRIEYLKLEIKRQAQLTKEARKNQEKLDQEQKKIRAVQNRIGNQNILLEKEREVCRKEVLQSGFQKQQCDIRKMELSQRLNEENQLIMTLKDIIKKLNKEITNSNLDKEKIRNECLSTQKLKEQIMEKLQKTVKESQLFYKRAQRDMNSQ